MAPDKSLTVAGATDDRNSFILRFRHEAHSYILSKFPRVFALLALPRCINFGDDNQGLVRKQSIAAIRTNAKYKSDFMMRRRGAPTKLGHLRSQANQLYFFFKRRAILPQPLISENLRSYSLMKYLDVTDVSM